MNINSRYLQINYTVFKLIIQGVLILTNEELIQLIKSGKGIKENTYLLYLQNMPLLKQWSKRYNELLGSDDVLQECYIALHNAVKAFEIEKGYKFTTYLQSAVKTHFSRISSKYSNTDISPNDKRLLMQYNSLNEKEQQTAGCNISISKAANLLSCSEKDIQRILQYISILHCLSIDTPINNNNGKNSAIEDILKADIDIASDYENKAMKNYCVKVWDCVHNICTVSEENVIKQRYKKNLTLKQTGINNSFSLSRVRQYEQQALRKLKQNKDIKHIAEELYNICDISYRYGYSSWRNNQQSAVELSAELIEMKQKYCI